MFKMITTEIKDLYLPFHEGKLKWEQDTTENGSSNLILPPWLCQPYVRLPPEEHLKKVEQHQNRFNDTQVHFQSCIYSVILFSFNTF